MTAMPSFANLMPATFQKNLREQAQQALDTQRKMGEWQLAQARKAQQISRDNGALLFDMGVKNAELATQALLDAQQQLLAAFAPATAAEDAAPQA